MDPVLLIVLLLVAALALAAAEGLLPTHGLLGVAGFLTALAAVGIGFTRDVRLGAGLAVGTALATPVVAILMLKAWEHSPIGRRLTLEPPSASLAHEPIQVGDLGTTCTALRPMGEAEFGPVSVQAQARRGGPIAAGTRVRVVHYENGVATVEPVDAAA